MKKLFAFLFFLLTLSNVLAQKEMKEFVVHEGKLGFSISSYGLDTLKATSRFSVLDCKLLEFYELGWKISTQVFTQEELKIIKTYKFSSQWSWLN